MPLASRPDASRPTVAVVGGGASGTLAAVHLLNELTRTGRAAEILLVDRDGRHGLGQAYCTADERHLLNATVARMSALADDPHHFLRWAARDTGRVPEPGEFLPRSMYGRYLTQTLVEAEDSAWPRTRLTRVTGDVEGLLPPDSPTAGGQAGRAVLELDDGSRLAADAVILATGNPAPAELACSGAGERYVPDPWAPGALAGLADATRVLVVGTGLTMLDLAVTLAEDRPGVQVHAVSRNGLLPHPHQAPTGGPVALDLPPGPATLPAVVRALRRAVAAAGGDWRPVVDALRPRVPELWAGLGEADRRRFLTLLSRTWEVHRHRVPPATAARIDALRAEGRLLVHRGCVSDVQVHPHLRVGGALLATLDDGGALTHLAVDAVVNATGPGPLAAAGGSLLGSLLATGLARHDPFGLGLDAAPDGALLDATGTAQPWLSTLGPPLRGVRWETTAIPEIRDQAAGLAWRLARALDRCPGPVAAPIG